MESVSEAIARTRCWFYRQLDFLKDYPSESHRLLILISTIDAFAQDCSGYSRQNQKAFAAFIKEYCKKHKEILSSLCPVTLYYDCFENDNRVQLLLQQSEICSADSVSAVQEAERLRKYIPEDREDGILLKHSYAGLIYQLRNKLSHEFLTLNMPTNFQHNEAEQVPQMACSDRVENKTIAFQHWALHIPEEFVKSVAIDAVEHYLEECLSRDYVPFNMEDRKCYKSWYDEPKTKS